jgi:hypothetical protein
MHDLKGPVRLVAKIAALRGATYLGSIADSCMLTSNFLYI